MESGASCLSHPRLNIRKKMHFIFFLAFIFLIFIFVMDSFEIFIFILFFSFNSIFNDI